MHGARSCFHRACRPFQNLLLAGASAFQPGVPTARAPPFSRPLHDLSLAQCTQPLWKIGPCPQGLEWMCGCSKPKVNAGRACARARASECSVTESNTPRVAGFGLGAGLEREDATLPRRTLLCSESRFSFPERTATRTRGTRVSIAAGSRSGRGRVQARARLVAEIKPHPPRTHSALLQD